MSLMLLEAVKNELVVVVTLEREEAVLNKSLMRSRGNDEELIIKENVKCDGAVMMVSIEVAAGENASIQLVDDSTGDHA